VICERDSTWVTVKGFFLVWTESNDVVCIILWKDISLVGYHFHQGCHLGGGLKCENHPALSVVCNA
jgi:hypothetical protein